MDHKRLIAGLLSLILCLGLLNIGFAEANSLYKNVENELAELKELEKNDVDVVKVQPGDTVYKIAQKYGTDVNQIVLANDLSDPSLIHVGDELRIPQGKELEQSKHTRDSAIQLASRDKSDHKSKTKSKQSRVNAASHAGSARSFLGNFTLTAYTAGPESTGKSPGEPGYGITASGKTVQPGVTIAADPNVIPMGSTVYIEGIGTRTVHDTGGAIKGNRIDVYIPDLGQARQFGVKKGVKVYVVRN